MMQTRLLHAAGVLAMLWPAVGLAQTPPECGQNPDQRRWFVQAGATGTVTGTKTQPFGSFADIERCAPAGAEITVLPAASPGAVLDGGIRLKDRQKLLGTAPARESAPRITNTTGTGDAITLAHGNEIANLRIENPAGAAVFGDNAAGATLRDLFITRTTLAAPTRVDASLCRVVRDGDAVDNARSTLRGCNMRQVTPIKSAVMLLVDDGAKPARMRYVLQRITIQNTAAHEKPEVLWPAGISVNAAGHADVTLDVQDTSIELAARGLSVRGSDRATLTVNITNTRLDSLRSDGIAINTGFFCSGLDKSAKVGAIDCAPLVPAPVSDTRVVVNADGLRFTDSQRKGQPNDAGAIEPAAGDQGRSTIELHVARSDIIGAAAAGVFTFYLYGRPGRDVMDFGCVNPAPEARSPDRGACRKLGYTSVGQNRIFGSTRNSQSFSPYVEVALQGPGAMMAQGNYWGDIKPVDGQGDALGECTVHEWSGDPKDTSPPIKPVPESRCELYNFKPQGNPSGIDGRFHLMADPRPPKQ